MLRRGDMDEWEKEGEITSNSLALIMVVIWTCTANIPSNRGGRQERVSWERKNNQDSSHRETFSLSNWLWSYVYLRQFCALNWRRFSTFLKELLCWSSISKWIPIFHVELCPIEHRLISSSFFVEFRDDRTDGTENCSEYEETEESIDYFQKILSWIGWPRLKEEETHWEWMDDSYLLSTSRNCECTPIETHCIFFREISELE